MKIGLRLSSVRAADYAAFAARADELGYDALLVSDHLACPPIPPHTYPYSESGEPPFAADTPWLDPLVSLAFVAGVTSRIRLITSVYILPLRHPLPTAKMAASLDLLSKGRLILGVGGGWMSEEFNAAGQEFDHRGTRTLEMVDILKKLWTDKVVDHRGEFYSFGPVTFEPKPLQKPHPPIHFGGETPVMLRRAARYGDGWLGMTHTPETAGPVIQKLQALRREYGRDQHPFEVTVQCSLPPTLDTLLRFKDAGVDRVRGVFWDARPGAALKDVVVSMEGFASRVMSKL